MSRELAFIGAGNMAEAIARSVLAAGLFKPSEIIASDIDAQRRQVFSGQLGIETVADNAQAVREARLVLLAVKPQQASAALRGLGQAISPESLIISILAGVSCARIEELLGCDRPWRIVRAMPNTPLLVGQGMVAIAPSSRARAEDLACACRIFQAGGTVLEVREELMDAVTALSGSGPAYFFLLVEQMIRAGVELGLTSQQAHILATQTALGAAKMLTQQSEQPAELRRKVTSPGGTTQAAIELLEARSVPQAIVAAIHRAAQRSRELGCR